MPNDQSASQDPDDTIEKLERLAKLKDQGAITEEEFEEQKKRVLAGQPEQEEELRIPEIEGGPTATKVSKLLRQKGMAGAAKELGIQPPKMDQIRKKYGLSLPVPPKRIQSQVSTSDKDENVQEAVKGFLGLAAVVILIVWFIFSGDRGDERKQTPESSAKSEYQVTPVETPVPVTVPVLTQETINESVGHIKMYPEVLYAGIAQDGRTLSLVVKMRYAISDEKAKEMGELFVRAVKSWASVYQDAEPAPTKEIGSGVFDYLITVTKPDEDIIVQGAKSYRATKIWWGWF